ncbi:MAG: zinc ribbon domain-containing protein [Candidatus Zixiibacteriota bacterium]|nr:MAG: zinc ribbon domain-containing protein [candidate division Zixibacteria bacterium]
MPLFEYKCNDCGHTFEELVSSHSQKISCPKCNSENAQRQLSAFATSAPRGGSPRSDSSSSTQSSCGAGGFK